MMITNKSLYNNIKTLFITCLSLSVLAVIGLVSCDSSTDPGHNNQNGNENGENGTPAANEVWMEDMSFVPGNRTVQVGTTVTWINQSGVIHTVTSGSDGEHDGLFDSGDIPPDGEFEYTFDEVGTYDYYCIPHLQGNMTGTITVTEDGSNDNGNDNGNGNGNNDGNGY
jgi:plastocyanin